MAPKKELLHKWLELAKVIVPSLASIIAAMISAWVLYRVGLLAKEINQPRLIYELAYYPIEARTDEPIIELSDLYSDINYRSDIVDYQVTVFNAGTIARDVEVVIEYPSPIITSTGAMLYRPHAPALDSQQPRVVRYEIPEMRGGVSLDLRTRLDTSLIQAHKIVTKPGGRFDYEAVEWIEPKVIVTCENCLPAVARTED